MTVRLSVLFALLAAPHLAARAQPVPLPFEESFRGPQLDPGWKVDLSHANKILIADGGLKILARQNTYAHIRRPLRTDLIRAEAELRPDEAVSWVASLFLYWDAGNWCQISVLPGGMVYTVELIEGRYSENRPVVGEKLGRECLAIELAGDCIRYQYRSATTRWMTVRIIKRPDAWRSRPPAQLIVGKGFSRKEAGTAEYPAPDLNNDYMDPGPMTQAIVYRIAVQKIAADRIRMTDEDRAMIAAAGRDLLGDKELSAASDPSFDSVARHFPPMQFPREVIGVAEGPEEYGVLPDGSLELGRLRARFEFGEKHARLGGASPCRKRLLGGSLPMVVTEGEADGLAIQQTAFVWAQGMSAGASPVVWLGLELRNSSERPSSSTARLRIVDEKDADALPAAMWQADVPPQSQRGFAFRLAAPDFRPERANCEELLQRQSECSRYWSELLGKGMQIETPEPRVNNAYKAWLAYNFINVDRIKDVYEPHDGGGGFYEAVFGYSAALYCHALDLAGHHDASRRYLESLMSMIAPDGRFEVNFGVPDGGALLLAIGEHYRLSGDDAWLKRTAPTIGKLAGWIIARRKAELSQQPADAPWRGLIKGKPYCDEGTPAYSYFSDVYLVAGMESAASALSACGSAADAQRLRHEARAYRGDILRSMHRSVLDRDGLKVLPMFPETRALLKRVDYSARDYYALVSPLLLEVEFLDPAGEEAGWLRTFLRERGGLLLGMSVFQDGVDHAYTYGYWMDCLRRNEIKRVLLGFYASLAYGMSRDTYASVEVTRLRVGRNEMTLPHLYSNTQQIRLLRNMLVREAEDRLILGQAVPRPWLGDGKRVRVRQAPTAFGNVGYEIQSQAGSGRIIATIDPPARRPPAAIELRLRHPDAVPISAVTVDGKPHSAFAADAILLKPAAAKTIVVARFAAPVSERRSR